jgi:uncharacterized protein YcfJ
VYEYAGERHHVHTDRDPGSSLPINDGKVVLDSVQDQTDPVKHR